MRDLLNNLVAFYLEYQINILLSISIVVLYYVIRIVIKPKVESYIERDQLNNETLESALISFNFILGIISLILMLFIWGFNFKILFAFSTGLIAITGVALFANWSILSNITSFFILLIHTSYKSGNFIRIIDTDNYLEGKILEIKLFNTKLLSDDGEIIIYPNNLLITRPIIVNPVNRHSTIGKINIFNEYKKTDTNN